jgi:hypothetical protein
MAQIVTQLGRKRRRIDSVQPRCAQASRAAPLRGTPYGDEILLRTPAGHFGKPEEMGGEGQLFRMRPSVITHCAGDGRA